MRVVPSKGVWPSGGWLFRQRAILGFGSNRRLPAGYSPCGERIKFFNAEAEFERCSPVFTILITLTKEYDIHFCSLIFWLHFLTLNKWLKPKIVFSLTSTETEEGSPVVFCAHCGPQEFRPLLSFSSVFHSTGFHAWDYLIPGWMLELHSVPLQAAERKGQRVCPNCDYLTNVFFQIFLGNDTITWYTEHQEDQEMSTSAEYIATLK